MNNSYLNFRTDMADERVDNYKKVKKLTEVKGVKVNNIIRNGAKITVVDVLDDGGSKALKKDIGKYITIEFNNVNELDNVDKQHMIKEISDSIKLLEGKDINSVLVVGLGNVNITPDALGPKVVSFVNVTRHVIKYAKELLDKEEKEISAIAPGVLGTTGIETENIIEEVVKLVNPDLVIAIDSLASCSMSRLGKTIQLSNTGITPGAGVGNKRKGLNQKNLSVPVIAIGVPTVVDMATITNESIDKLINNIKEETKEYSDNKKIKAMNEVFDMFENEHRYEMIANTLDTDNYIVTPKEIDVIIDGISEMIASGINEAFVS